MVENEEVWTVVNPEKIKLPPYTYNAVKIEDGLKICVREDLMKQTISENELSKKFDFNIKRINRWYWSIYFKKKIQ